MKLAYAGAAPPPGLIEQVEALETGPSRLPTGLEVIQPEEVYRHRTVDAALTVGGYRERTRAALAAGYRGLRVVAEITDLVRTEPGLDAVARYELQLGPATADDPFSAMCAFSEDVGPEAAMQLACLHPSGADERAPFRIALGVDGVVHLSGEMDLAVAPALGPNLHRLIPDLTGMAPVIDMSAVTFIDHRALGILDSVAAAHRTTLCIEGAPPLVERITAVLDFPRLAVGPSR